MILFYAIGGGLGHLSRVKKIIDLWRVSKFKVITACSDYQLIFKTEEIILIPNLRAKDLIELNKEISEIIKDLNPEKIVIDTFPLGLLGEWSEILLPESTELVYICRNLKWKHYKQKIKKPIKFDHTYFIEKPEKEHLGFVENYSRKISFLKLKNGKPSFLNNSLIKKYDLPEKSEIWLVVHSFNKEELQTIVSYAQEISKIELKSPFFLILSNISVVISSSNMRCISYYPASDFFPFASRIFTACGFNIMSETELYVKKHYFIPFDRKYDNQYSRAIKRRKLKKLLG